MDADPDLQFGRQAVAEGHLTDDRLREALADLAAERERSGPLALADFLVQRGILTLDQVRQVQARLRTQELPPPVFTDLRSGRSIVRRVEEASGLKPEMELRGPEPAEEGRYRTGDTLGERYAVAGELARGGMGRILDARDLDILRPLAIKVMLDDQEAGWEDVVKFIEEAQIQGQLEHPNICPVHELGVDAKGRYFFTMKKVKGKSLAQILEELREFRSSAVDGRAPSGGTYTLFQLLEVFNKVCDAVAFAHSRGVIHRDLKPDNVMIGEFGEVLVMDWGIAKILGKPDRHAGEQVVSERVRRKTDVTMPGMVQGTPTYMSPEQAQGMTDRIDERTDIYALGGILYSILTLKDPVRGKTVDEILKNVAAGEIIPPSERAPDRKIPPDLDAAALKAMAGSRKDRYQTVKEFQADIQAFLEGRALAAATYTPVDLAVLWVKRNRVFAATASAAAAVLILATAVYFRNVMRARAAAEREAERARTAEGEARRQSGIAGTAREAAELRLAEALVAQGDALGQAERWRDARTRYQEAFDIFRKIGADPFAADLGLMEAYAHAPPPLMTMNEPEGRSVFRLAVTPDGTRALSGAAKGVLTLWDLKTGRRLRTMQGPECCHAMALAVSADGRRAVSGSHHPEAWLWDLEEGSLLRKLSGHRQAVHAAAVSPDGRRVLTGSADRRMILWDADAGTPVRAFSGHGASVAAVAFSSDGRHALSGGADRAVVLWDLESGARLHGLHRHDSDVRAVAFSPDGTRALSGGEDRRVNLWDLTTGQWIRSLPGLTSPVTGVAFSPDGGVALASGHDNSIRFWDVETAGVLRAYQGGFGVQASLGFAPVGAVALQAGAGGTIETSDLLPGPGRRVFPKGGENVSFAPDGLRAVSGRNRMVRIWDVPTGRILREWKGHMEPVTRAVFSPDGRRILTASTDKTVRVWDAATGRETAFFGGHGSPVMTAAFSPDGRRAASGGLDRMIRIFDPGDGRELLAWAYDGIVNSAAFSPDGLRLLTGGAYPQAVLWDAADGKLLRKFSGHEGPVHAVAFSRDGRSVLTGGNDGTVRLWDAETGGVRRVFTGHGGPVVGVDPSEDGRHVLSGSRDGTVRIWDAETGAEIRALTAELSGGGDDDELRSPERGFQASVSSAEVEIGSATFSPDGRSILAALGRSAVHHWDLDFPERNRAFEAAREIARARLQESPADPEALRTMGEWFVFRSRWAWAADLLVRARRGGASVSALALARCHRLLGDAAGARAEYALARSAGEAPEVYLDACLAAIDAETRGNAPAAGRSDSGAPVREPAGRLEGHLGIVGAAAVSPDGRTVATASSDGTALVWDLASRRVVAGPLSHRGWVVAAAFSPDGRLLATGGADQVARIWRTTEGFREEAVLSAHENTVRGLAFSPDGKTLATGSFDKTVRLWEVGSWREVRKIEGHEGAVTALAWTPDGRRIVTGSADRTVRVWDAATGRETAVGRGHTAWIRGVAVAPDGRTAVSAGEDGKVNLWDVAEGKLLREFAGHTDKAMTAAFSPDGRRIASGGEDRLVRIWNAATGEEVLILKGHTGPLRSVAFTPDGKTLITAGADLLALVWDLSPAEGTSK